MYFYVDAPPVAPVATSLQVEAYDPRKRGAQNFDRTTIINGSEKWEDKFNVPKGPLAPTATVTQSTATTNFTASIGDLKTSPVSTVALSRDEIDDIAKQRVRLMAQEYAGGNERAEIVARLEILNRKLSAKMPLVSSEQVAALEAAQVHLDVMSRKREERRKRLGICA